MTSRHAATALPAGGRLSPRAQSTAPRGWNSRRKMIAAARSGIRAGGALVAAVSSSAASAASKASVLRRAAASARAVHASAPTLAGHSKWANIKHRKARADSARMKAFSKTSRLITAAAKVGGTDLEANPRLADIVAAARAINMPKALIDGAIKRGGDPDSAATEELWYEGTGQKGFAIVAQCFSDNKNRTRDLVRSAFTKHGGAFKSGVSFMFEERGEVTVVADPAKEDALLSTALEAGAEDVEWTETMDMRTDEVVDAAVVITATDGVSAMEDALKAAGWYVVASGPVRRPTSTVELPEEDVEPARALLAAIEEVDGVEAVFHNVDLPEEASEDDAVP